MVSRPAARRVIKVSSSLGVLAAIFAIEQLVEVATVIGAPGTFIAPGGPMNLYLGGTLFVIFFLALGTVGAAPVSSRAADSANVRP